MGILDWIAEERIESALQSGAFDNLPGRGQPLRLDENPHEPEDWRIAFRVLRNNGYTLPWIELSRQIETNLENARADARRIFQRIGHSPAWTRHTSRFLERIAALNRQIFQYNLLVPSDHFQRPLLDPQHELAAVEGQEAEPTSST